jgi:hypothetical protein
MRIINQLSQGDNCIHCLLYVAILVAYYYIYKNIANDISRDYSKAMNGK